MPLAWVLLTSLAGVEPAPTPILPRLIAGNDGTITAARRQPAATGAGAVPSRGEAVRVLVYVCGYVSPHSRYFHDESMLPELEQVVAALAAGQHASGLWDVGNLESPPDTGFMLESLAKAQRLLLGDARLATENLRRQLRAVIGRAATGVAAGGVHTPNHRWGVSAALALAHRLDPEPRSAARIAEWLAEGIDQDADGQFAERSPAYTAKVVLPALLTLAEELPRPELLDAVRRSLALALLLTEANGDVVTIASRRQDQRPGWGSVRGWRRIRLSSRCGVARRRWPCGWRRASSRPASSMAMEPEIYQWMNGSLGAEGQRVYLTGVTPFEHALILR